jgi:hypothetical protein
METDKRILALLALALVAAGCVAPVQVEWTTETEMNTAGFNLYRGASADGPFDVKINDRLIPPAADPLTGGQYSYTDRTARPGKTYYYQLQEVETTGEVNSFGPIEVQTGWLTLPGPVWALVLIVLALAAAGLWVYGGRRAAKPPAAAGEHNGG